MAKEKSAEKKGAEGKKAQEKFVVMGAIITGSTTILAALIVAYFTLQSRKDSKSDEAGEVDQPQQVIVSDTADSGAQFDADSSIEFSSDSTSEEVDTVGAELQSP